MKIKIKNNWDSITWNEYEQIEQILNANIPAEYKTVHLISVLAGMSLDEVESIPINQFQRLLPALEFLDTTPQTRSHRFEYTINGRTYEFRGKLEEITTAQYIDYRAYMDKEEKDVVELMSAFMIPKGHEYNDGYDMELVRNDIKDMEWLDIRAASFFFRIQLSAYILILKSSLVKSLKKTKKLKDKKQLKEEIKQVEESLNNTAYYLLFSEYVQNRIPDLIK